MKRLLTYLPFHFLVCYVIGILIQYYLNEENFYVFLFPFFLIGVLSFLFKKTKLFIGLVLMIWCLIGIIRVQFNDNRFNDTYFENVESKNSISVVRITKKLKPGNYYNRYIANVIQVDTFKTSGLVLLNIQKDSLQQHLHIDDQLVLKTAFKELLPSLNPYQFNYKSYLAKQNIHIQVFVNANEYGVLKDHKTTFLGSIAKMRTQIQNNLKKFFKEDELAVVNALLLGQRQEISKDLLESYTKAGAIHILAISGLHVGILLLIVSQLLQPLERIKNGKMIKLFLIVLFLWFFALLAGLSASVVRAVSMFTAVAIGMSVNRKHFVEHSLIISMLFILLVQPMFLFDVGFQLSYLAVFGIVWVQPKLYNMWLPKYKLVDYLWKLVTVSVAAQFGILPISLFYFHQFPGLFILSNLMIIPFLGIILFAGILVILLSSLNLLPNFLAVIFNEIIKRLNLFVSWISKQEAFLLTEISMSFIKMLLCYGVIILGFQFFIKRNAKRLILFLVAILFYQSYTLFEKREVEVHQQLVIFHKSRQTMIGVKNGGELKVFHSLDSLIFKDKTITNFKIQSNIQQVQFIDEIPNYFEFQNHAVLVVDNDSDSEVLDKVTEKPLIVILRASPKIHLERLLYSLKPVCIIADGSNYKSSVDRWKLSCLKTKTPFWYTGQNGAYMIDVK